LIQICDVWIYIGYIDVYVYDRSGEGWTD
jgi:hypothetical protein